MKKTEKKIIEALDAISVTGFAVTAVLSAYHFNIPTWLPMLFAVLGLGFSIIGMLGKKDEDEVVDM